MATSTQRVSVAGTGDEMPTYTAGGPNPHLDCALYYHAKRRKVVEVRVLDEAVPSDHRPLLVVREFLAEAQ